MTGPLLAADLVNLARGTSWSVAGLEAVLAQHHIRRRSSLGGAADELRGWAGRLRTAFSASDARKRCKAINALLENGTARAFLTTHNDLGPHLHFIPEDNDVVARVKAVTAGGLAMFTVEAKGSRLGVCARHSCGTAFVDTSRNGLRKYCSTRCGNYDAVHRHRAGSRGSV